MAKDTTAAEYLTTVELPSRAILYSDRIPAEFTLRAINTQDEKVIFGSSAPNVFSKIVRSCIVDPVNLDMSELLPCDEHYLLLKLRAHSYGSTYRVAGVCEECGHKDTYEMDLESLEVHMMDPEFVEPFELTLPKCGKKVSVKLLRNKDWEAARRQAKKIAKSTGASAKELEYIFRMAKYIQEIDGEKVDTGAAQAFVEGLVGYDSAFFWSQIDEASDCGVDTTIAVNCTNCGEEFDLAFQINSEFFRPKFG